MRDDDELNAREGEPTDEALETHVHLATKHIPRSQKEYCAGLRSAYRLGRADAAPRWTHDKPGPFGETVIGKDQEGARWLVMHDGKWNCMEMGGWDADTRIVAWAPIPEDDDD